MDGVRCLVVILLGVALATCAARAQETPPAPANGGGIVVRAITFTGNTVLTDEQLSAAIATKPGQPLDREQVVEDALAVRAAYEQRGYPLVDITDINLTPEGELQFTLLEARIGEIRIQGNERTRAEVIRALLEVRTGEVYNVTAVRRSLLNLQRLGIFENVSVNVEPGAQPGTIILVITVEERRTGTILLGTSYSEVGGFSGYVEYTEANLFGAGRRVDLRVQLGARQVYQATYVDPLFGGPRSSLAVSVYDRELLHQAVFGNNTFDYVESRTGGSVTVGRRVAEQVEAFATFRLDRAASEPETGATVPAILLEEVDVRSLALSAVRDTREALQYPTQGSYALLRVETAGLFGGDDFTQLRGEARRYWTVRRPRPATEDAPAPRPWVVASRLLTGISFGGPALLDQFLVGGAETLRGYELDRFPGERVALLNTELRVPVTPAITAVGFVDIGDAWSGRFAQAFGDADFTVRYGYGAGIRIDTPIGPLRLDYGLNDDGGQQFHFGIGQTF